MGKGEKDGPIKRNLNSSLEVAIHDPWIDTYKTLTIQNFQVYSIISQPLFPKTSIPLCQVPKSFLKHRIQ